MKIKFESEEFYFFNLGHLCVVFKTQIDEGNNVKSVSNWPKIEIVSEQ